MNKKEFLGASLHAGLKVYHFDANRESEHVCKIEIWHNEEATISDGEHEYDLLLNDLTPILRPFPDLTKPITHNGEMFVPSERLACMYDFESDNTCQIRMYINTGWTTSILELPFDMVQQLIKWHFNLMDESEPFIPVTDEFNPYK